MQNLKDVYSYRNQYVQSPEHLIEQIINKTIIPHQIEVQPGPKSKSLCWLKCPYCYGGSSQMSGESLSDTRYIEILSEIAQGGVKKFIFAGYATDPLNYKYIDRLVNVPFTYNAIIGFHTKAIKVSDDLIHMITTNEIDPKSYFSVSVDAGDAKTYNKVHGMNEFGPNLYDKVKQNIEKITNKIAAENSQTTTSATYLLNSHNSDLKQVSKFIYDFKNLGMDLIRFSFPQTPRGYEAALSKDENVPNKDEKSNIMKELFDYIKEEDSKNCRVLAIDYDDEMDIENIARTIPCFARWVFPSIGFDGYLGHCSEAAAPHFKKMSLGNLNNNNFWDLYYDYDPEKLKEVITMSSKQMSRLDCRCDRKEHQVNKIMKTVKF